jgi:DNA recombination protein Rad52
MTAFSVEQKRLLEAPLNSVNVKSRSQSGRTLSYIEGWHAIAEANRIFGFDAWSRETIDLKCVSEKAREIGQQKAQGWGVTYTAKVRITVGDVIRDGCGTGHGIDRDLGQAHESALKEAETDAMKRALMTFGNPFGLALYDKTQANVVSAPRENPHVTRPEDIGEPTEYDAHGHPIDNIPLGSRDVTKLSKSLARGDFAAAQTELRACKTITHLQLWGSNNANRVASYPPDWQEMMRGIYADHMADLRAAREAAE